MNPTLNLKFRKMLEARQALLLPGAANALAARAIEDAGFDAIYITGAGIANTFLGMPDIGLTTLTEVASHVAAMRDAVEVPLVVDGDTGFGNALNMARTIRVLERAGASAIQIEDQDFPKRCGHFSGKAVIGAAEMVQKIKAAVDARSDPNFTIIARTDSRAVEGFDAAVERLALYHEAGAEATFLEAPTSLEEIRRIPKVVPGLPILNIVFGGKTPMPEQEELKALGFSGVLYANTALQAALAGMQLALAHLKKQGSLKGAEKMLAGFAERQKVVNKDVFDALEQKYALPDKK
jgi:2-methylisocitrate lyase-like PEP mutase family enzyme